MRFLQYLTILLFVSAAVLPLIRSRYSWAKWARWGSVAIFSAAVAYAVVLAVQWRLSSR